MALLTMGETHRGSTNNIMGFVSHYFEYITKFVVTLLYFSLIIFLNFFCQDLKRFRCHIHEYVPHDELMGSYLRATDFGNLLNTVSYFIDYKFILAIVERLRPETHIFDLSFGECTIALEDVCMLLGLSIKGRVVNGKVY